VHHPAPVPRGVRRSGSRWSPDPEDRGGTLCGRQHLFEGDMFHAVGLRVAEGQRCETPRLQLRAGREGGVLGSGSPGRAGVGGPNRCSKAPRFTLSQTSRLLLVLLAVTAACERSPVDVHCPSNSTRDAAKTQRLTWLLEMTEDGRTLRKQLKAEPTLCFGPGAQGVVQRDGAYLLPKAESEPSNAARLAHLMLHRIEGLTLEDSASHESELPCPEQVDRIMDGEKRAHAVENRIRSALGLPPTPDTLAELARAYAERCATLRRR
jgi:hypothetical protein